MSAIATPPPSGPSADAVTPDDLLKLEQQGLFELVDGELIEKPMGSLSGRATGIITTRLCLFTGQFGLGEVMVETTFRCFPKKPLQVRRPDIAFVLASRAAGIPEEGHVPIRPDLCIEVVSPDDGVYDLEGKLMDYRSAGIPLTWVFNPKFRNMRIYRPDKSIIELDETDTLSGEQILQGFTAVVSELFPPPKAE